MISYKNRENLLQNVVDSLYYFNRIKFIYKNMANEIHSLKIGNTEYPIYSEGLKIDDQVSGSAFLVVDGPDNRKVGTSTAIIGDDINLTISSNEMYIGTNSATELHVGDSAEYMGVGNTADWVEIGNTADRVDVGNSATELHVGDSAEYMRVGNTADLVEVGNSTTELCVGYYGTTVGIGNSAEEVNIGRMSYGVNIGNQCEGNVVIGDGSVWTYEDEDGNEVVEKTTSTFIGENNYEVNIGPNASSVILGGGAKTINIGSTATDYLSILSYGRINIDSNHGDVDITSENNDINILTLGSDGVDNGLINIEAERDANMIAHHNINIDADGDIDLHAAGGMSITCDCDLNIGGDSNNSTEGIYIGHNSYMVDISGHNIYIGDAGISEVTEGVYIKAPNININGDTRIYPYECTTTEMNTGFSILRGDNAAVGVVFCAPSLTKGGMLILPKNAYNSTANVVSLGNTAKRFGAVYVTMGKATNGFTTDSDERLKDFGDDIAVDLDALAALRKSYYRWNETSGFENEKDRMLGMSAQEVQKIYPEVVNTDEDGMLSMAYDRLSVVALAAIDKLHETNKELKAENDELKDRIANLENLVDTILSRIN